MSKTIPFAREYKATRLSPELLDFANHINRTKTGDKGALTYEDPEYYVMEHIVSDEAAKVGLGLKLREHRSAKQVAQILNLPEDHVKKCLDELAVAGASFVVSEEGEDKYWLEIWVPGHMEMIMNNKENGKKYPEIAIAFDAYGKKKGLLAPGVLPMGMSPMRVIPIETAIDSNSRRASHEEISKYLKENTIFSVSDCSCRTVRESMGEGCGHLKEDMCIQMGHAAEYYIKTGRAREVTREEAFAIIDKAEENGLMHQIPNLDGAGETHAICNCCGCGCLALRNANMFQNPDFSRSNYVAKVDSDKCVACGECVENCPVNALKLGQKIQSTVPLPVVGVHEDRPENTKWGVEKWNVDYRTNREVVLESGTSPCKSYCPAHIGIQGYIKLASQGKYREALELIKKENPFPAVCGHICPRYCEEACTRNSVDESVAIDDIKRFIAEQDMNQDHRFVPKKRHDYSNTKVAVVGAGPAGLSCAYYLSLDNYDVTVFEKEDALGGMLTWGIPSFRLERNVIESEIQVLREMGVKFKTSVEVGKDITLDEMRKDGYKAFYMAPGAQGGRKINVEGEDLEGVQSGIDFLRNVNLSEDKILSGKTIVVGGGNVAIDVARTAMRAGASSVAMYCLEKREEMPALVEEIEEALSEGIEIYNSLGPKKITSRDGKLAGIEFKRCISVFDEEHRFKPTYDETDTTTVEADNILISVGQSILWGDMLKGTNAEINPNQTLKADSTTYQTGEPDIFVGGDAYTGPKFAIDAIAQGKEGAISIHRFVNKGQSLVLGRLKREYKALDVEHVDFHGFDKMPRQRVEKNHGENSKYTFRDTTGTYKPEQIQREADRCLSCGKTYVDEYMCVGCGQCTTKCKFEAISLVKVADAAGVDLSEMKPYVIKNIIKNKGKTFIHSSKKKLKGKN